MIEFLQSPLGITIIAMIFLAVAFVVRLWRPGWYRAAARHKGLIINAVKMAEKTIPNDTRNAGLRKADVALNVFLRGYEEAFGRSPSSKLVKRVREAMPVVHAELEARGALKAGGDERVGSD